MDQLPKGYKVTKHPTDNQVWHVKHPKGHTVAVITADNKEEVASHFKKLYPDHYPIQHSETESEELVSRGPLGTIKTGAK